ncbi:MAG: D-sedoheptulose 7-phosphate isomerase [bacterium]|nr:D-sedoheptulose 7-phosphate isomerase [bacterium]
MTTNTFSWKTYFDTELEEHAKVLEQTHQDLYPEFEKLLAACAKAIRAKNKIFFFGNGGSAADAQHLATELTIRYKENRDPIAAIALTTDSSTLTAAGNDLGFEFLFSRQIEALGKTGDVAIGISTSGQSPNVTRALEKAKDMGMVAASLSGRDGGVLKGLADPLLIVPSHTTSRIQEMHITLGQMLCGALEKELGLV